MECRWLSGTPMKLSSKLRLGVATLATGLLFTAATASAESVIDLISNSSDTTTATGAQFFWDATHPAGSGVLDPFVRVQRAGANDYSAGYNTSDTPDLDTIAGVHTHAITLDQVGVFDIGGTDYYGFTLDINQNLGGDSELLSIQAIKFYQASVGSINTMSALTSSYLAWDLDAQVAGPGGGRVDLDQTISGSGSGTADMVMYVKTSYFDANNGNYLYLYSEFGPTLYPDNDGYQEWATLDGGSVSNPVPLPGIAMAGMALFGVRWARRRRESATA
jgi:hypothetical protein